MSVYLALARVSSRNLRAGGACVVFTNRITGDVAFGLKRRRQQAEEGLMALGFRAVEILHARDSA